MEFIFFFVIPFLALFLLTIPVIIFEVRFWYRLFYPPIAAVPPVKPWYQQKLFSLRHILFGLLLVLIINVLTIVSTVFLNTFYDEIFGGWFNHKETNALFLTFTGLQFLFYFFISLVFIYKNSSFNFFQKQVASFILLIPPISFVILWLTSFFDLALLIIPFIILKIIFTAFFIWIFKRPSMLALFSRTLIHQNYSFSLLAVGWLLAGLILYNLFN